MQIQHIQEGSGKYYRWKYSSYSKDFLKTDGVCHQIVCFQSLWGHLVVTHLSWSCRNADSRRTYQKCDVRTLVSLHVRIFYEWNFFLNLIRKFLKISFSKWARKQTKRQCSSWMDMLAALLLLINNQTRKTLFYTNILLASIFCFVWYNRKQKIFNTFVLSVLVDHDASEQS